MSVYAVLEDDGTEVDEKEYCTVLYCTVMRGPGTSWQQWQRVGPESGCRNDQESVQVQYSRVQAAPGPGCGSG